jgi:putative transposase
MRLETGMNIKRRSYTQAQRDAVVQDVGQLGVCGAARKHGVPKGCVSRWASEAGIERVTFDASVSRQGAHQESKVASAAASSAAGGAESSPLRRSRSARLYTPSQKAETLEYAAKHGVSAAAEHFSISRFSIYDWQRKAARAAAGQGEAPTSGMAPQEIEAQRDREILAEWHKHPGLGPSQIVNQLRRAGIKVSVHTARRVMEEAGYRPPKVQREPHAERYEAVRPNHMWHLDFVQRYINRSSTFTLILIDDCSRYVVGHGVDDAERAAMVVETFEQAVERHGRPERVMHDKGSAFWSWRGISRFTQLLVELGIDQIVAEHKEWNGKVEVFNGNLHKELFNVHRFSDVAEMRRRLAAHLEWYNHGRTHHALGGLLVPADRYYGRVDEVLARIEAGAGRDASDLLELRERCLELFRVTSRGGVPEVWLLGKKLLGASSLP